MPLASRKVSQMARWLTAYPAWRVVQSALVREALKALIERESARRLARLGGSEPDIALPPRRLAADPS